MTLKIHNSLTRTKQTFTPIEAGKVKLYVCGMTVYDLCHLGHARVMVVFDTVVRHLRASSYQVTYVRNITDIDDKIIQRANDNGEPFTALTERFIQAMHEDAAALGVQAPDIEPRATEAMDQIIAMIERLIANGHAYAATNGDVMYDVASFANYGQLSGKNIDELRAGERVEVNDNKRDPLDFVLWKAAKPGEPAWDSPWGQGRPGWHIECSAMSTHELGEHFDIHGGGMDLQFPHHDNEIAQSEGASCKHFVNYWMHNGFVRINDEKMSKSLGNFFTVREVLNNYPAEVIRYFILTSQYRSPLHYDNAHLDNARSALNRFYTALRDAPASAAKPIELDSDNPHIQRYRAAMDDDFNTPEALAVLFELTRELNKARDAGEQAQAQQLAHTLRGLGGLLGLLQDDPEAFLRGDSQGQTPDNEAALSAEQIDQLIDQRIAARANKDWAEADRIRELLNEHQIIIEDRADGARWRRA